jgi:hypothetical protein
MEQRSILIIEFSRHVMNILLLDCHLLVHIYKPMIEYLFVDKRLCTKAFILSIESLE